ncbi:MAG: Vitamin B12 transporter BtuB [Ignavibacteria bacterium]|nr:Vitamin B12 transporter BtuB [Ignavibacteria bacterium]
MKKMKNLVYTILLFMSLSQFSIAQEEDEKEEGDTLEAETQEIIITGTRTPEKIIDIPFSVFKVDKKELKYGRNLSLKDVLADVPGLFLQTRYGSHDTKVSIRGYGTRSNTGVRGIRILQDAIPESEPDGETNIDAIDYSSLSTVEVAKGNLSSLYTNAPGGVINFITDMDFSTNYVKQTNQIGSFDLRQNGVKTGLMTKNYKFYLSYNYRNYEGFRDHSNEYIHLLNSILQIYPDSRTTISVLGNYANGLIKNPGSLTKEQYENDPSQAYSVAVSSDFKRDLGKGRIGIRYNTSFGKKNQNELEATGYLQIRNLQFTTNTLYTFSDRYSLGGIFRYANKSDLFSHKNVFSTGLDYNYVYGPYSSFNNVAGTKGDDLQHENIEKLNNAGLYFQDQFYFYKDISSIFISGRYDDVNISNDNQLFSLQNSVRRFSRFTPRIALNFKITPKIAAYTSYGFAFNTPAAAELSNYSYSSNSGLTTLNPDLEPEKSKNFEIGIKGNVFGKTDALEKIFFEVTFYNTEVENEIVPFVINDAAYFRNAANTNRKGIEMGLKLEMFEGLEVMTNYTFSDFQYKDYTAINYTAGGDTLSANYSGNIVPGFPKDIVNFILNYKFKFRKDFTGLIQWDMDYIGRMYVDDANSDKTSDYFYGNCMLGMNYTAGNFNFLLTGGVKNIFDRKYVGYVNINANPELPPDERRYYEPGEPRNFYTGLNIGYGF